MSSFIVFIIVVGIIVYTQAKKNQARDEQYRQNHPGAPTPQSQSIFRAGNVQQTTAKTSQTTTSYNRSPGGSPLSQATAEMRRQAEATKARILQEQAQRKAANGGVDRTAGSGSASTTASSNAYAERKKYAPDETRADGNSVYQQMRQTTADTAAAKVVKDKAWDDNQVQRSQDAYSAEAKSISTDIDTSKIIDEVYEILACGYHPDTTLTQRDFVGEGLDMLNQYN